MNANPKKSPNSKRSDAARKGWETRRKNAAIRAALVGSAVNDNFEGEQVIELTERDIIPFLPAVPPPLPLVVTDDMIVARLGEKKLPPPLPRANRGLSILHERALRAAFA